MMLKKRRATLIATFVTLGLLGLLGTSSQASAQAFSYQVRADVPAGQKPQLRLRAEQDLVKLNIELVRDDGKRFKLSRASLGKGESATFPVGDGKAGRASYKGVIRGNAKGGGGFEQAIEFSTLVRGKLSVSYDWDHLDLEKGVLQFRATRPVTSAQLEVYGEDGSKIGAGEATYRKMQAGSWVPIKWKPRSDARVMRMVLRVSGEGGASTTVELIPWSVTVDHEDVHFATASSVIEASERPKLDDSLGKIRDIVKRSGKFMKMKLYVAGHTDTVGRATMNRELSTARARAIASYFRKKGLRLPIVYAGFGEDVPKVKTPDNTDSAANRRADYVLGPEGGAPPFAGAYTRANAAWRSVP